MAAAPVQAAAPTVDPIAAAHAEVDLGCYEHPGVGIDRTIISSKTCLFVKEPRLARVAAPKE